MCNLRRLLGITCSHKCKHVVTRQACLACTPSSPRDACVGSDMCAGWNTVASQRTSCMESSPQECDHLTGPPYAIRIPARQTWRHVASNQQNSKQQHQTALVVYQGLRMVSFQQRKGEPGGKRELASNRGFSLPPLIMWCSHITSHPCLDASVARVYMGSVW